MRYAGRVPLKRPKLVDLVHRQEVVLAIVRRRRRLPALWRDRDRGRLALRSVAVAATPAAAAGLLLHVLGRIVLLL